MQLKVQKLHPDAKLPSHSHPNDAGMDVYVVEKIVLKPGERAALPTGIALEIPEGYVGLVWDKSGISIKKGMKTVGGVIDAGYRGEVLIGMINLTDKEYVFEKGDRVAQILVQKVEQCEIVEAQKLSGSARGEAGFGSTGK